MYGIKYCVFKIKIKKSTKYLDPHFTDSSVLGDEFINC